MKTRALRARKISVEASRQAVLQPCVDNHIRWPILVVVCIAVAGVLWLRFGIKHLDQPDAKSVEQATVQASSDVVGESVAGNAGGPQGSRNGGIHLPAPGLPWNANKELVAKLSALAASAGMTEEVETAIHEVAALGDSVVPELRHLIQADQSPNVREAAARALAEIGTRPSIATLLEAVLSEQDGEQRCALVSSLHALNNPAPAAELTEALLKSQDPIISSTVRDTLARVADAAATRTIAQTFHSDAHEDWQQSNLMGALLRVNSGDAVSALREIVIQDTDLSLRSQAAVALARIGNQEAIQSLFDALGQTQSPALQQLYVESLSAVNNKDSLKDLVGYLSQGTNETVRYIAARALGNIPNEASADALRSASAYETSETVKQTIEASLSKLDLAGSAQSNYEQVSPTQ
jgi:HEAT repeat protein